MILYTGRIFNLRKAHVFCDCASICEPCNKNCNTPGTTNGKQMYFKLTFRVKTEEVLSGHFEWPCGVATVRMFCAFQKSLRQSGATCACSPKHSYNYNILTTVRFQNRWCLQYAAGKRLGLGCQHWRLVHCTTKCGIGYDRTVFAHARYTGHLYSQDQL